MTNNRKLRVFLCQSAPMEYASQDKPVALFGDDIRELYQRLLDWLVRSNEKDNPFNASLSIVIEPGSSLFPRTGFARLAGRG
jgi:hypothetical protein